MALNAIKDAVRRWFKAARTAWQWKACDDDFPFEKIDQGALEAHDGDPPKECRLKVLTLNYWGLPFAPRLEERVAALARRIATGVDEWDLICLQEAWLEDERQVLQAAGRKAGLRFSYYCAMGMGVPLWPHSYGSGLLCLSRYPIIETVFSKYPVNGKPYKVHHGDYFATKGVALTRLLTPAGPVDVYATHLISYYHKSHEHDEYETHRAVQAYNLGRYIAATRNPHPRALQILLGDFNADPASLCYDLIRRLSGMHDSCLQFHHPELYSPFSSPPSTPRTALSPSTSFDCSHFPFKTKLASSISASSGLAQRRAQGQPATLMGRSTSQSHDLKLTPSSRADRRSLLFKALSALHTFGHDDNLYSRHEESTTLDFIFYYTKPTSGWRVSSSGVYKQHLEDDMEGEKPVTLTPVSDHYGVIAEFKFAPAAEGTSQVPTNAADMETPQEGLTKTLKAVEEAENVIATGLSEVERRRNSHIHRCMIILLAALVFCTVCSPSTWFFSFLRSFIALGMTVYASGEFFLASFVVRDEIMTMRETIQQMRCYRRARTLHPQLFGRLPSG